MNLTLQHCNIDFDFPSGGPLRRDEGRESLG
jgi:hypothetical protein